MKEAIQTLITSDKMAHAFEYLKQDEAHTIDQQIELVQISSFSPFEEKRAIRFKELLTEAGLDPVMDEAGPSLMFITLPKVFAGMGFGTGTGILFFLLVLFAAVTSSIALTESAVSTFEDELHWSRKKATVFMTVVMIFLGTLSCLGYDPLADITVIGMQFLDFFDFLTNSVMMPIAAIATCLLVSRVIGVEKIENEVTEGGHPFKRKAIFQFMIKYLCPIFAAIILVSSVANAFGWISM